MYKDKDPITLSGNVYVGDYLAPHYPEHKLPAVLQAGDLRIDSHLDERGRANREKKTKKARYRGYSGYFTAVLFDGQSWRKFRISDIVEHDGWYTSQKWKHWKISSVIWKLERVGGRIAVAGDGTYVLSAETQAAPEPEPVAVVVAVAKPVVVATTNDARTIAAASAKPTQLELF